LSATVCEGQTRPADFAIRFEFGRCTTDVLDTSAGVFVRDMGIRDAPLSALVTLPEIVMQEIYEAIIVARFFEYPSTYRVTGNIAQAPSEHYKLQVTGAGVSHTVSWHDAIRPSTPEADRLRRLFESIKRVTSDLPQIKALALPRIACG
jgi:hypothetical protein